MRSPTPQVRLDGYVRVSRVGKRTGPQFISPTVQREAIEAWAAREGVQLQDVFEELDQSARSDARRPLLELAVERIEQGVSAGLVVWRVDRFGRSLNDGVQIIERIRAVDGRFYSVNDGLDISTEAGRLALRILLSVAEFHLEGLRDSWDAARANAIRRGVYVHRAAPLGYRKTRSGRLQPDPTTAPVVAEIFRRRVAGTSLLQIGRYLMDQGVPTSLGNPGWCGSTVNALLKSPVYIGQLRSGRHVNDNGHPPLIDAATWQAAQRPGKPSRSKWPPMLLAGLARCASCSHMLSPRMSDVRHPRGRVLSYVCSKHHAGGTCPAPGNMSASKLEPYVLEAMFRILGHRRSGPTDRLAAAEAKAEASAQALTRYRDNDRIAATIGQRAFIDGLAIRQERLRETRLDVIDARAHIGLHGLPPVANLRRDVATMTVDEERELLGKVIDVVFVARGRGPAAERVTVCPAGTAPRRMPRQGDHTGMLRSIKPRRGWLNPD